MSPSEPTVRPPAASRAPSWRGTARIVIYLGPPIVFVVVQAISLHDFLFSPEGPTHRDWVAFHEASQRMQAGEKAYLPLPDNPLQFLYPPPLLWAIAPLGRMPLGWAYAACVGVQALSIVLALALLRPALGATWQQVAQIGAVLLGTLQLNVVLFLGQLSATFTAVWVAALAVLRRSRSPILGGMVLSLLLVKPNLLLPTVPLFLAAGVWRLLAGVALGGIGLFALTLPLGLERWAEWSVMIGRLNELTNEALVIWKQVSLWTFWRVMIGPSSPTAIAALSAMLAVLLTAAGMVAWHRCWSVDRLKPRLLGSAVLLTLLVNPHSFYYDTLLLLVPASAYWVGHATYAAEAVRRVIGSVIAAAYVGSYLSVAGELYAVILPPLLITWFVLETIDLIRGCVVP